jgi:hypothetical protein
MSRSSDEIGKPSLVQDAITMKEPGQVGVFWFLDGRILFDALPLDRAETYGCCLSYPCGHEDVWKRWKYQNKVPLELEYDTPARGRISFDCVREQFLLLADACILADERVIATLMHVFDLPADRTTRALDSRYRCTLCLRESPQ